MGLARSYVLESQFEHVAAGMNLRRPQRDSLRVVHELVRSFPTPICKLRPVDLADRARQLNEDWTFPGDYPSLTFALATGVGKTRLAGAIAAYLFRTGESRNILILAPRDAILRKFEREAREAAEKYLFVDPALVPQPRVCHRGNLLEFRPSESDTGFLPTGPNLFIFSPQLLVVQGRIAEPSEFAGSSIMEYLRTCDDLVVFVDESHHLSSREHDESVRTWGGAVSELAPKLVFELTATPRPEAAVAHEYGLAQCLRERLYTKAVRMIVDERGSELGGDEYDAYTLRFGLARLRDKQAAVAAVAERMPGFPPIRPVLLISAVDTKHADRVGRWLIDEAGFESSEVLVIHSKRKTEEDMEALASIETPESTVRAVVQVHVLDEGWDVTNVFVIAPLRNVNSYINARQMMGRGLRLPAGRRIGDPEVDTLDVLAFGQQTFQDIYRLATAEFGAPDDETGGVQVVTHAAVRERATDGGYQPTVQPEDHGGPETKVLPLPLAYRVSLDLPVLDLVPPEPDLAVNPTARDTGGRMAFDLGTLTTATVSGELRLSRERFEQVAVDQVFADFPYISDPIHRSRILALVRAVTGDSIDGDGDVVDLDPVLAGKVIAEALSARYRSLVPEYRRTGRSTTIPVAAAQANVPLDFQHGITVERVRGTGWAKRAHFRLPIGGWQGCVHQLAHFDSRPEFEMACRLDRMGGVRFWLRNEPGQIVIPTLIGNTKPDFVVWLEDGREVLLEIKGEYLWEPKSSDSWVRARDLKLWVEASGARHRLAFVVVLGAEVDAVTSLEELFERDAMGKPAVADQGS